MSQDMATSLKLDAVVVGAGAAGLSMLKRLRDHGFSVRLYEAGDGVGGVWYWNRYPGARCDAESVEYQFGFSDQVQRGWDWTERYASQPEIVRYMNYVVDVLDLRRDMQFGTRIVSAIYDDAQTQWSISTDTGENVRAQYCIMATGCLSSANVPAIEGLNTFKGAWYHTSDWPSEGVVFTGKRVAVIGTGSSGIQTIPLVAQQASHLYVLQRTPNFSIPAFNEPLDPNFVSLKKETFIEDRKRAEYTPAGALYPMGDKSALEVSAEELSQELEKRWCLGGFAFLMAYKDILTNKAANDVVADFVRDKIRNVVKSAETAALLTPEDYPFGTKRPCLDTGYFETFNKPHVTLVDVRSHPIRRVAETGIQCGETEYQVDAIVFATGFDAMTGTIMKIDIRGKGGLELREKWAAGPRTYLGLMTASFPNLFILAGPGSPSVLSNGFLAGEQHANWVSHCLEFLRARGFSAIDASVEAEDAWVEHVNEVASRTLYPQANSWYMGANVPGKPRIFMPYAGGFDAYRRKLDELEADDYRGFQLWPDSPATKSAESGVSDPSLRAAASAHE
jgi:cyclohexanone monooxygenase